MPRPFHVCMLFEVGLSFNHSASYRLFYLNPFSTTNRLCLGDDSDLVFTRKTRNEGNMFKYILLVPLYS